MFKRRSALTIVAFFAFQLASGETFALGSNMPPFYEWLFAKTRDNKNNRNKKNNSKKPLL